MRRQAKQGRSIPTVNNQCMDRDAMAIVVQVREMLMYTYDLAVSSIRGF